MAFLIVLKLKGRRNAIGKAIILQFKFQYSSMHVSMHDQISKNAGGYTSWWPVSHMSSRNALHCSKTVLNKCLLLHSITASLKTVWRGRGGGDGETWWRFINTLTTLMNISWYAPERCQSKTLVEKKCQNSHMEASWERCELLHQGRCPIYRTKSWLPSNRPTNFGCQATDQQTYLKARQNGNMYLNSYLEYNLPKMFLWREPEWASH